MSETRVQTVLLGVGCLLLLAILVVTVSPPPVEKASNSSAATVVAAAPLDPAFVATVDAEGGVTLSDHEIKLLSTFDSGAEYRDTKLINAMEKAMGVEAERIRETIQTQSKYVIDTINDSSGYVIKAIEGQ